ncbi:MAG: N-6 DNA methylase [Bacteroidales bacterium]|nr:N-6 DNA methylase [Bacteroidales bacterium]
MSLNTQSLQPIINFIWTVADDVLINKFLENDYQKVILPMTVLRRLDLALEPTKDKVLKTHEEYKSKIDNLYGLLTSEQHGTGLAFYNTSKFTMKKLLADPKNIDANFLDYLNGYSENVQDIINKFEFRNHLRRFEETGITFSLIEKFCNPKVELSPEKTSPMAMGYMFEDLIRRFNEKTNAAAGRHFTPREIIELMTHLVYLPVKEKIQKGTFLVYDPCVGSGAMLTQSKAFATNPEGEIKSEATFHLYGQENTGEMYAVCKSDMLLKGEDPDKIKFGSTLSEYGFDPDLKFNFMLTNPPYGTSWKQDIDNLNVGTEKKISIVDKRFNLKIKNFKGELEETCLTSRSNDGQLMFMLHMLSKMKESKDGGSRIASVHNASALFNGEPGSGESMTRQYIIENDLLETVIALPPDMFYNTNISSFILVVTNVKEERRKGKIQLINATHYFEKMDKPLGKKRKQLSNKQIEDLTQTYLEFKESDNSLIFKNEEFGYKQINIFEPLIDENGMLVKDTKGAIQPDKETKMIENVPINNNIKQHIEENVKPLIKDVFYDDKKYKIGYDIPFPKFFFEKNESKYPNELLKTIREIKINLVRQKSDIYFNHYVSELVVSHSEKMYWLSNYPRDWEILKAKYIFKEISVKNTEEEQELLSVTQDQGVIPRDLLDKDVMNPSDDLSGFKLVTKGDFVISLRSFQGGLEFSEYEGLVSPAYTVLKNKRPIDSSFYKFLFKSTAFISALQTLISGIRDGKSIKYKDFGEMYIPYPKIEEQIEIGQELSNDSELKEIESQIMKITSGFLDLKKVKIYE